MAAAAHDPAFAKKVGIPQRVAKDFNKADAGTGILKRQAAPASRKSRYANPRKRGDKGVGSNALTGSALAGTGTGIEG